MKNVCLITIGCPLTQPRVRKQLNYLYSKNYKITLISNSKSYDGIEFFKLHRNNIFYEMIRIIVMLIFTKSYEKYFWTRKNKKLLKSLEGRKFDLVIIHGIRNIQLGIKIANGSKVLFDAHEYYPENFSDNWFWKISKMNYYKYLCENYLKYVDYTVTVSKGIGELYKKNFNIENIEIITNSSEYFDLNPTPVDKEHIKIIHHGDCSSSRKLELMIEAAKYFNDNIHLYLMLVVSRGYKHYYKKLRRMARKIKNVHFIEPVKSVDIVKSINKYDIGLVFVPPTNTNLYYGLGNKFFEFIQARLMVISGPSVEMVRYIEEYKIGLYSNTFDVRELANLINKLTVDEINFYKNQSNKFARELSYEEQNIKKLENIFNYLLH